MGVRIELRPASGGAEAARFAGELLSACEAYARRTGLSWLPVG